MTLRRILFPYIWLLSPLAFAAPLSEKVLARYKEMLATKPAEGTALDRLWQAYAEEGRTAALIADYEKQPGFAGQMVLGQLLKKAGRHEDAAQAFQRALSLDARNPGPALALGRLEMTSGHPAQAAIWLTKAAELLADGDAQKTAALLELGSAQLAAGDLTAAAEVWEKTIALAPSDIPLRKQLAETYTRNRLGERAIPHLRFIEQRGQPQERAQALQQMAAIHQAQGEQDAAILATEKALEYTAPGNWLRGELQAQLIRLHQRYHRTAELEAKWTKYAEENPRDRGGYLQLIDFYERTGDRQQQLVWLEKLVQATPKENEYRIKLARLLAEMDDLGHAAKAYDELLASQPRNIELVLERARIDVQRDQPQLAGERISALLRSTGNDEGVRAKVLEFYQANRLRDLAEKHLREESKGGSEEPILALAHFLFTNHREGEARETLNRLVRDNDPEEKQAAALFRIADELKSQNELPEATSAIRKAIDLKPDAREYHFTLGELEAAAGHYTAAEVAFENAFGCSKTPAEALEADQRLYDSLRNQKPAGDDDPKAGLPRPDSAAGATSAAAQGYLLKIQREAVDQPSEQRWLRVARWQEWSRNGRMAVDSAERALTINPKSIAGHDFLARHFAADPQTTGAQQHLRELIRLDPANRRTYLRRLGQVLLQTGQMEEALKTFRQLVDEAPGDLDSLNELAIAQQRSEQWREALATLQQIFTLSPSSRKRDAASALLRVYERLAMRDEAAKLLLEQIDGESENKERFALFQELLTLCSRNAMLDWLRMQFEARQKLRADDYFTEVALGRVLKAQGNKAAAFETLSDAALAAPNPAEALPELVREAEELRRLSAAVQLQAQLVRVVPQTGTEGLERLAQLQEKNLQPEEAGKTWLRITTKFPRDVSALEKAAEFERTWGTAARAAELLRRIRTIEPANLRALARLAELDISEGKPDEAIDCLEAVLSLTAPEKAGEPIRYPAVKPEDPSRLEVSYYSTVQRRRGKASAEALRSLREFWFEKAKDLRGKDELGTRLETIRDLAEVIASRGDGKAIGEWVNRWQAPEHGPSERLWALYYAGANGPLLDEVQKLIWTIGGDGAVNAFIWLALETGEFDRLSAWVGDKQRTPADRDFFMVALEHYFRDLREPVPPSLVEKLFPEGYRTRLWQAATAFAQRGLLREAIQLGTRVYGRLTGARAGYALELARWHIQIGEIDAGLKILRAGLEGSGEGYSAPEYAAIRAAYLLVPPSGRTALVSEIESGLDERKQPVHTALVRSLLAGLAGDEKEAHSQIDRLVRLRAISPAFSDERATAATRHWDFLLTAGMQLMAWQLDELAAHLWQVALADEAAIALQIQLPGQQGESIRARVHEVRMRLAAIQLMHAAPEDSGPIVTAYSRYAPADGLLPLAETLEAMGGNSVAVRIYRQLWEQEPTNPHALRNALSACRGAGDWSTLEEILSRVVTEGLFRQNDAAHRDLVQQLAEVFERREDFEHARAALAEICESGPHDARALLKLANLQERCGQVIAAETTYAKLLSREPTNIAARLSLAALLDNTRRTTGAIDLLERASGTEVDGRLAELNLKAGRLEEALAALERVPSPDHARVAQTLANQLIAKGDNTRAQYILRTALARTSGEQTAFVLQSQLLRILPENSPSVMIERETRRLRQLVTGENSTMAEYFTIISEEAVRLGLAAKFEAELRDAWKNGQGDLAAGVALLRLSQTDEYQDICVKVLHHQFLDSASLKRVIGVLEKRGDEQRRIEALGHMARLDPEEPRRLGEWARALAASGRQAEAVGVANELAARAIFNPEVTGQAGELFALLGDAQRARELYRIATLADPTVRSPELHLAYVRLLIGMRDFASALAALKTCSRNPMTPMPSVLLEYLKAADRLDNRGSEFADLNLSSDQWLQLRRGVFAELLSGGQVGPALRLAEEYPHLLGREECRLLRENLKRTNDFEAAITLFEQLRVQGGNENFAAELSELLLTRAESELALLQVNSALVHLEKAHELAPGKWSVAERLTGLYLDSGEPGKAIHTVRSFLSASTDPTERDKAKQVLSRISPP